METRKTEKRIVTSEPKKMLDKYIAKDVYKVYTEEFTDEDTGEPVAVERKELLHKRGILIDQDTLAKIRFDMEAGDIKEVEVSDQCRAAVEQKTWRQGLFMAQATIGKKKEKFLLYADSISQVCEIVKDYIELNHTDNFYVTAAKYFNQYVVIMNDLENPDDEEAVNPDDEAGEGESKPEKKFYAIDCKIMYDDCSIESSFLVKSVSVDKGMKLIEDYLLNEQEKRKAKAEQEGGAYETKSITPTIEKAAPMAIGCFIPAEFSKAYETE